MDENRKSFINGWVCCAGFIADDHGEKSLIEDAILEHGLTVEDLKAAGVEDFDLCKVMPCFDFLKSVGKL